MPYDSIYSTHHQLKYPSSNRSQKKKKEKKSHTKEPTFQKMEVQGNGPKAEKDKTARATGLGRRTKEEL